MTKETLIARLRELLREAEATEFSVGDEVTVEYWGRGIVVKVDTEDRELPYSVEFADETLWLPADRLTRVPAK